EPLTHYRVHGTQTRLEESRRGRLAVVAKHVPIAQSNVRACANFHAHAGAVYYMAGAWKSCRREYSSALRADASIALRWPVGRHLLSAVFPQARLLARGYRSLFPARFD